jgi:hypothetical protein
MILLLNHFGAQICQRHQRLTADGAGRLLPLDRHSRQDVSREGQVSLGVPDGSRDVDHRVNDFLFRQMEIDGVVIAAAILAFRRHRNEVRSESRGLRPGREHGRPHDLIANGTHDPRRFGEAWVRGFASATGPGSRSGFGSAYQFLELGAARQGDGQRKEKYDAGNTMKDSLKGATVRGDHSDCGFGFSDGRIPKA